MFANQAIEGRKFVKYGLIVTVMVVMSLKILE